MVQPFTIVTGASEGIGRCFAESFARQGRNLVLVARNRARLDELKRDLEGAHSVEVLTLAQDLSETGAARKIHSEVGDRPVDCLINNAGFQVPMGAFLDSALDEVRSMIAVNILAVSELTRLFLSQLIETRGAVVNVASHAAFQPVPFMAAYAASKSYVLHFSEALHSELHDSHPGCVHVVAVCPGATRTKFWDRSSSPVEETLFPVMAPERVVALTMQNLKRRRKTVLIPSSLLALSTESLRFSPRTLNTFIAKKLVGH